MTRDISHIYTALLQRF